MANQSGVQYTLLNTDSAIVMTRTSNDAVVYLQTGSEYDESKEITVTKQSMAGNSVSIVPYGTQTINGLNTPIVLTEGGVTAKLTKSSDTAWTCVIGETLVLPVYEDNAAAITGGLEAGDTYRTETGVMMVVFTPEE